MRLKQAIKREAVQLGLAVLGLILAVIWPWLTDRALWVRPALSFLIWLGIGWPILRSAVSQLRHNHLLGEAFLMAAATVGALAIGEWPEAAAVMVLYRIGEALEAKAVGQSRASIAGLLDLEASCAHRLLPSGETEEIDLEDIEPGDRLLVSAGEKIPVDAEVIQGSGFVDTSALTGESVPLSVQPGTPVLSGALNGSSVLMIKAKARAEDSTARRIVQLLEEAGENPAPTETVIQRFARYYTPVVVAAAVALAFLPPLIAWDSRLLSEWVRRALNFLVVSCPCAFVISVPMAYFAGIGMSSKLGILVKGGAVLDRLAAMDTLALDKTGTLTEGRFSVIDIHLAPDQGERVSLQGSKKRPLSENVKGHLEALIALEAGSTHPLAVALRRFAGEQGVQSPLAEAVEMKPGYGLIGQVRGQQYAVGNAALMTSYGLAAEAHEDHCDPDRPVTVVHWARLGETPVYLGHVILADQAKPEARQSLKDLRDLGIKRLAILTGDGHKIAAEIGRQLAVSEVHAGLLPDQKLHWVLQAKQAGRSMIGVVGDGLNDAPVLARADIGIAMGGVGSQTSIEAADAVLLRDDLATLPMSIRLARQTHAIVWQNLIGALVFKFAFLLLSALGLTSLWMAVFADVGVTLVAVLNAMRLFAFKRNTARERA